MVERAPMHARMREHAHVLTIMLCTMRIALCCRNSLALASMLPSVRPANAGAAAPHVGMAQPFFGTGRPRSSRPAATAAAAQPQRPAGGQADTAQRSDTAQRQDGGHGGGAAVSRRGVLLSSAAAAAATVLAGEQRAQAVQGITAGRLPGTPPSQHWTQTTCCSPSRL